LVDIPGNCVIIITSYLKKENEMDMLVSLGIAVGLIALAIGLFLALKAGIDFLKVKIGEAKFNQIVGYAELAVRAAEQVGIRLNYSNEEKKAFVLSTVRQYADKFGIEYDEQFLEDLIESAVQKMNAQFGQLFLGDGEE
jgi:hypothetical protein